VNAGKPEERARLLTWERLEDDLFAAAACTSQVYVFSLEGCVEQGFIECIAAIDWRRARRDLSARDWRAIRRRRALFRLALRAERLADVLYPSRAPSG